MSIICYRINKKFEGFVLNKRLGLLVVISIPLLFFGGYYIYVNRGLPAESIDFMRNRTPDQNSQSGQVVAVDNPGEIIEENDEIYEQEPSSIFMDKLSPIYAYPKMLTIQSVGIDINLVPVGVEEGGQMEAPKEWNIGGWFKRGALAGEEGNLIINAHYDDNYGRPAAFWNLKNVKVDDKVLVVDRYARTYIYQVNEVVLAGVDDPDNIQHLASIDGVADLTLITCGGFWMPGKSTYSNRLIVKAKLIDE